MIHIKNTNKGFTLIELLVVIAIIGILASVVLASLSTARAKGKDAAIKSALPNAIAQAEIEANGGNYSCTDPSGVTVLANIKANVSSNGSTLNCTVAATTAIEFDAALASNSSTIWCVDNNGFAGVTAGTPANGTCGE